MSDNRQILFSLGITGTESETELLGKLKVALTETTNAMNALIKTQAGRAFKSQEELKSIGDELKAQQELKKSISDLINAKQIEAKEAKRIANERTAIIEKARSEATAELNAINKSAAEKIKASDRLYSIELKNSIAIKNANNDLERKYELREQKAAEAAAKIAQANTFEEGSIMQLRQALAQATKQYDLMGAAERTAAGGKALENSIQEQMKALSALEQKTGRFQRNVGNYASGFNGLSNSINQVTRELPNFAQSATIGFMALSNNLPILADEIKRVVDANRLLQAEGKATTSVIGQIAKSIFSWQSALITVISLSVIYAKEIGNFIFGTKKATESTDAQAKAQEKLNQEIQDYIDLVDNVNKQRRVDVLGNVINGADAAYSSLVDIKEALKSYQEQLDQLRVKRTDMGDYFLVTDEDKKLFEEQKKNLQRNIDLLQAEIDKRKGKSKAVKESNKQEEESNDKVYESVRQNFEDELNANKDFYAKRENLIKASFEKGLIDKKSYEDEVYKLTEQRILREIELQKKYNIPSTQSVSELESLRISGLDKTGKIDLVKGKGTFSKDRSKEFEEEQKNRKLAIDASIQAAKQTVDAISQIKQDALDRDLKRELTAIQRNMDKEDRILQHQLENGFISESQYAKKKQDLNDATAAKELEANKKAFEEKKRLDTATAIANGALAITSILAQYPKFDYGIAAAIAIGSAVATTATQVAVIQAQKFALGGKIDGKSHAQGGIMIEAEGGESVINKQAMRSSQVMSIVGTPSQIASSINSSYGGVSWESGATSSRPNQNMFSNSTQSQSITYEQMAMLIQNQTNAINDKEVYLLESKVTKTQKQVKMYESSGRF